MPVKPYTGVVYKATHAASNSHYIGKSIHGLQVRRWVHEAFSKHATRSHFHSALRLYGSEEFTWEELYFSDSDAALLSAEVEIIASHTQAGDRLYNMTRGGEGASFLGKKHTEETKQRIRAKKLGVKLSEESKIKQSEALKRWRQERGSEANAASTRKAWIARRARMAEDSS